MADPRHVPMYEEEKHVKTLREIEAELAKQYPSDFPEMYREQNVNMDRLFVLWHHEFQDRFLRVIHEDIKRNDDENVVALYEKARTPEEKQAVINEIKRRLY